MASAHSNSNRREKWDGCDGLVITDMVKVTVASQAALMLLGMRHSFFRAVRSIGVFPSKFEMLQEEWQEKPNVALGQAAADAVLLAWDSAFAESRSISSGRNLVIHEFAHHLDFEDGYTNGRPELRDRKQTNQWHAMMTQTCSPLMRPRERTRRCFWRQCGLECNRVFLRSL